MLNSTGKEITVEFTGKTQDKKIHVKPDNTVTITNSNFNVVLNDCKTAYPHPKKIPEEFLDYRKIRRLLFLQINPDGLIYVLSDGASTPIDELIYSQPEGFPLHPQKDCFKN